MKTLQEQKKQLAFSIMAAVTGFELKTGARVEEIYMSAGAEPINTLEIVTNRDGYQNSDRDEFDRQCKADMPYWETTDYPR